MKTVASLFVMCSAVGLWGCKQDSNASATPPKGTLHLDGLPPDQQIAKVQSDPSVPERYKQLYINSVRAKQGQPPQAQPNKPPGGPQ